MTEAVGAGIAQSVQTLHGLGVSGFEPRRGRDIFSSPHLYGVVLWPNEPCKSAFCISLTGVQRPGRGAEH